MTNKITKTTSKDIAHALTKGGLGAIPIIGSLASEIFGLIVTPPLEKRRAEWMNEIAIGLKSLENQNMLKIEDLKENEQFIDVVLQATNYALKTSVNEKIKAFQNAILNTAIGQSPDKTVSQIFLNQLDRFTLWHIKILILIDSPRQWYLKEKRTPPEYLSASMFHIIIDAYPELKDKQGLLDIIWNDLNAAGFHKSSNLMTIMTGDALLSERISPFGKEFLNFITNETI